MDGVDYTMIIKSFVLIEEEGYFLLIREATKKWKGKWFLPGGKVVPGETPVQAGKREVKEEAGCEVSLKGLFYIRYHEKLFTKQISLFYCAKIVGGKIKVTPDRHSLEVKWFTYNEIKGLEVRQKLLDILINYHPKKMIPPENFKFYT